MAEERTVQNSTPYTPPVDIYTYEDLNRLIRPDKSIAESITIRGEYITHLPGLEKILGTLGISESIIENFGDLKEVTGDVWFSFHLRHPSFESIGKLEHVGGTLNLSDLTISSLGKLKSVGGNLNLRNTSIENLGSLEHVGDNLSFHKSLEGKIDLTQVRVLGNVKFANRKNRFDSIAKNHSRLSQSDEEVPFWRHEYALSADILNFANRKQKKFYSYVKETF